MGHTEIIEALRGIRRAYRNAKKAMEQTSEWQVCRALTTSLYRFGYDGYDDEKFRLRDEIRAAEKALLELPERSAWEDAKAALEEAREALDS